MQRVRRRLNRIQQDPLLTPSMSLTCIKPKQLISSEYQDCSENDHCRGQMIPEYAICPKQNDLIKNK